MNYLKGLITAAMMCGAGLCATPARCEQQPPVVDTLAADSTATAAIVSDSLAQLCKNNAVLSADSFSYNAGVVNYKRELKHEFKITNIGSKPLIVISLRTSSSSLKVKFTKKPLNPGESAKMRIEYEIDRMPLGEFMRNIEVTSNSCGKSVSLFTISGHSVDKSR